MDRKRRCTGVRVASESSIEIRFRYKGKDCRERLKLKPTPTNIARAERFRGSVLHAIENGTFDYEVSFPDSHMSESFKTLPTEKTIAENYIGAWLEMQRRHLKVSTWTDYDKIIRSRILPHFGCMDLNKITRLHVRQWCGDITAGNKRLANIISVLRSIMQSAMDDGLIADNILDGFTYRRKEAIKKLSDVDPFNKDEQTRILDALGRGFDSQARNLIQFAFWTGLRTSELVALDWSDIDLIAEECHVNKAWTQSADEPEVPKTKAGVRTIKLLPPAVEALRAQKPFTFLKGAELFQNPLNCCRWAGDKQIRMMWVVAVKKAGVRYRRPYQTRHTYASMMLSAGENPMWVAKQMGHADWTMIARVYGKWMPDAQPDAGKKAVAVYGKAATNI